MSALQQGYMVGKAQKKNVVNETVAPVSAFIRRLSVVILIVVAIILMVLSRIDHPIVGKMRTSVMDLVVPVLSVLSSPVSTYQSARDGIFDTLHVFEENERLREENARLKRLESVAVSLEAENTRLRQLVRMIPQPNVFYETARVVGDTGGPYARSVLINLGEKHDLHKGQVVKNEEGLVGRIMDIGQFSARVMLLTDISSRVPVVTEKSRVRAVLAGNNSTLPHLIHLPDDSDIRVGERVLTAGDGDYFAAGIPVGEIYRFNDGVVLIRPLVDWGRLDYVNILVRH